MGMMIDMVPDEHDQLLHCIETDIKAIRPICANYRRIEFKM